MKEIRDRYEIFLKVCETGSFSKAAEALNYTQSGISQMMAGFEEELGVQLFARAKKGVTLTDNSIHKRSFPPSIIFYIIMEETKEIHILRVLRHERDWENILLQRSTYTYPE